MSEMTAAERYAQLKENRFEAWLEASFSDESLKGVQLYEVTVPSGLKLKCRKIDAPYLTNAGRTPMALSNQVVSAETGEQVDFEKQFQGMSSLQRLAAIESTAQMVRYIAVEPRLVEEVGEQTNAIAVAMLTIEDFNYLAEWAGGGESAEGLKTFRKKRR